MTNLFDALEFCLREIEEGGTIETALARFPEHAEELRPILETSVKAREMAVPEPSPNVVRRSRALVLQRAAELRESRVAPRSDSRRGFSLFQRLALSFALVAVFLMSGGGLLSASASALPGEQLYTVKRGWENVRLFFIFDTQARALLEHEFENERLHEANELILEGRHEVIQFAGVFMQVNGLTYVSGLPVTLPATIPVPANGDAVVVSGRTNSQGFVEVINLEFLPAGSVVPIGKPIEVETESDTEQATGQTPTPSTGTSSGSTNEATPTPVKEYEVKGTLEAVSTTSLVVTGMTVYLENSKIDGQMCVGVEVEVKGYYAQDGRFIVKEAKSKGSCTSINNSGSNSGSGNNSGSNNESGSNSSGESNSNGDDSGDDHGGNSGKDGGGGDDND
ncbi:MAG TPA: DUF5667 domain-containing protein [Anaerolineales bacterium]|nr:DUF5667 domain-containing protein [Anaerolineales bacterium]